MKMLMYISSVNSRLFCPGGDELNTTISCPSAPFSYLTTDDGIVYVKGQDDPVDTFTLEGHDTTIKGVLCAEIGGENSTEPLIVGAELGLPVVDMDFMGRAFPELQVWKYYSVMLSTATHNDFPNAYHKNQTQSMYLTSTESHDKTVWHWPRDIMLFRII